MHNFSKFIPSHVEKTERKPWLMILRYYPFNNFIDVIIR